MPTPGPSEEELLKFVRTYEACGHNLTQTARVLNRSRPTLQHWLNHYVPNMTAKPEAQELPPSDLPFEERLETMKKRNSLRIAHAKALAWQTIRVPVEGPYGLCWFGDPHLDDPFCDLNLIEEHAAICRETEALYGCNGGDSINNWVGRLERLYAEQSATSSEAWELVDWFMNDLGINWLLWILGNHDVWNYGSRIFERMNTQKVLMRDWDAKLKLVSPSGEATVWARHDFKGHSMYNEMHGLKRASMMDEQADIYAAFHRHTWGVAQGEMENGRDYCLIRARGYKMSDDYALKKQFTEQLRGQSVVTVIEPRFGDKPLVHAFKDVETGADFLTFLRQKGGY
jgi:hypothetical protein